MSTTRIGRQAEHRVASFLATNGYTVLARNWRTRTCEIDIIARNNDTVYFFEVKYRKVDNIQECFDIITPLKLRQMYCAAQQWSNANQWSGLRRVCVAAINDRQLYIKLVD